MKIKDGYIEFFESFKIKQDDLIKFGLDKVLLCDLETANLEWDKLKTSIKNKNDVHIRGYVTKRKRNNSLPTSL